MTPVKENGRPARRHGRPKTDPLRRTGARGAVTSVGASAGAGTGSRAGRFFGVVTTQHLIQPLRIEVAESLSVEGQLLRSFLHGYLLLLLNYLNYVILVKLPVASPGRAAGETAPPYSAKIAIKTH